MLSHNISSQFYNNKFSYNISISRLNVDVEINLSSTSEASIEETVAVLVDYINTFEKIKQS